MRTFFLILMAISGGGLIAPAAPALGQTHPTEWPSPVISEIMYHPARDDAPEFVELHNPGDASLDLGDMRFTAGIEYTFPIGARLEAGDYLTLAADTNDFERVYGFAPFDQFVGKLDNGGEILILRTADGEVVLTQPYNDRAPWPCGADGSGFSLTLHEQGAPANGASWRLSTNLGGSPDAADPEPAAGLPAVVINEILAHTDPPLEDAVELHNPTGFDASLAGWFLSDKPAEPRRAVLGNDAAIPAGGYLVVGASKLAEGGFALSENGETLLLSSGDCDGQLTGYRESVTFDASPNGVSLGRFRNRAGDFHFPLQRALSLGAANAGPQIGPVVISEIMYNPPTGGDEYGDEYIEVTNIGNAPVPLYHPDYPYLTWRVSGVDDFALPQALTLSPDARLLITPLEPAIFRTRHNVPDSVQIVGPYGGELDNSGERVALLRPDTPNSDGTQPYIVMDRVTYGDAPPWPTTPDGDGPALRRRVLAEYGDDPHNWRASDEWDAQIFLPIVRQADAHGRHTEKPGGL